MKKERTIKPKQDRPVKVIKKEIETFTLTDEDDQIIEFQVARPSVKTYAKALKYFTPLDGSEPDMLAAGEIILRDGFRGGDQRVLTETDLIVGASLACFSLINLQVFDLKKN
jgi:hypothetical protein